MNLPGPQWVGIALSVSEATITLLRQSKHNVETRDDRGSLRLIWVVVVMSLAAGVLLAAYVPQARLPMTQSLYIAGLGIFSFGLLLRWYSILHLGRYFTVDVSVAADHKVIDTGPYRFVRHPSYTGVLLECLGFSICLGNWASVIVIMTGVVIVFSRRIRIEEEVLQRALGQEYVDYMRRTRRLIPFVY
jgi:protein-S-isoprenylcysteine O-methyltransferase